MEWIPVTERLPKKDDHDPELGVLVTLGNGYSGLQFDTYHEATEYDVAHWYDWDRYVIAWMPLPAPYKQETTGTDCSWK